MNFPDYKITNIINYVRKSRRDEERERRTGEDTLEEQKRLMARVLDDMGIPYEQKFEVGSGDKISSRPVFQSVLEELKIGKYDAIAVKEISRLGRGSYADMGIIYDLLQEKRIYIITPWKIYDPNNPTDARQIRFELFLSREEFETIRERLVGARYSYAMQGKWMTGKVPYGYKLNKQSQKLEIVEEEAKIVKLLYDLFVNGINGKEVSYKAIATYLKNVGIKTPNGLDNWDTKQLKTMLSNPAYIGQVRFRQTERRNGKVFARPKEEHIIVENAHEPIVDELIWYSAQKKMERRQPLTKTRFEFDNRELTGLMVCSKCSKKLVLNEYYRTHKKKDGEVSRYHDYYIRCRHGCIITKYEHVERSVYNYLKFLSNLNQELLKEKISEITSMDKPNDDFDSREEILKSIEQQKKELKNRLRFIFDKFESGVYSDEDFLERKGAIEKEISKLEKAEKDLISQSEDKQQVNIDIDSIRENINSVIDAYDSTDDPQEKNKLLRAVFDHIVLEVLEKGKKGVDAKIVLTPVLKYNILKDELLPTS